MTVAFEGMDGVGKSTTARMFAEKNGLQHVTQKIVEVLHIDPARYDQFVHDIRKSDNKVLAVTFYTFRCMFDQTSIDTVLERTMLSTYFYEKNNMNMETFGFFMNQDIMPDLTFILYASKEERLKRIKKRNPEDKDLKDPEVLEDGYTDMINFANKFNVPYVIINTETLSLEKVTEVCTRIYEDYKQLDDENKKEYLKKINEKFNHEEKAKCLIKKEN